MKPLNPFGRNYRSGLGVFSLVVTCSLRARGQQLELPAAAPAAPEAPANAGAVEVSPNPEIRESGETLGEPVEAPDVAPLFQMSMEELMSVRVSHISTADRRVESLANSSSNMTVITAREIEAFGGERLIDILDRVVGAEAISTYISRDQNMAIRGQAESHRDSHTLFLIDGRPVRESLFDGQSAPLYLAFPLKRIARIEILRGPSSVLYGTNAFLGVINIITKSGAAQESVAKVSYGTQNSVHSEVAAGWTKGDFDLALGAHVLSTDGWRVNSLVPDPRKTPGARHDYLTADAAKGANLRARWKTLSLNATYVDSKQRVGFSTNPVLLPTQTFPDNPFSQVYMALRRAQVNLGNRFELGTNHEASLDLTFNHHSYSQPLYESAHDVRERGHSNDVLLEYMHHARLGRGFALTAGVVALRVSGQLTNPSLKADADGKPLDYDLWSMPANPNPWQAIPAYTEMWGSGYGQLEYELGTAAKIFVGAQANKVGGLPWDVVPRGGVISHVSKSLTLKILYGEAYRSPSFFERDFRHPLGIGNSALGPETIRTLESVALYSVGKSSISLSAFSSFERGLIVRTPLANGKQLNVNRNEIRSEGVELDLRCPLLDNLFVTGSGAYYALHDELGNAAVFGLPKLILKAGIAYSPSRVLDIGWFNSYFGAGDLFQGSAVAHGNPDPQPFLYGTLKVSADVSRLVHLSESSSLKIYGYANNLYDAQVYYPEYTLKLINSIPGRGGRSAYGGVELSW